MSYLAKENGSEICKRRGGNNMNGKPGKEIVVWIVRFSDRAT